MRPRALAFLRLIGALHGFRCRPAENDPVYAASSLLMSGLPGAAKRIEYPSPFFSRFAPTPPSGPIRRWYIRAPGASPPRLFKTRRDAPWKESIGATRASRIDACLAQGPRRAEEGRRRIDLRAMAGASGGNSVGWTGAFTGGPARHRTLDLEALQPRHPALRPSGPRRRDAG